MATLAAITRQLGLDDPFAVGLAARLKAARAKRDEEKPLLAKVRAARQQRGRAQKAVDRATSAAADAAQRVKEAQEAAAAADADLRSARGGLARDAATLAQLQGELWTEEQAQAVEQAPPTPASRLLSPAAVATLGAIADKPEVLAAIQLLEATHTAELARGVERARAAAAAAAAAKEAAERAAAATPAASGEEVQRITAVLEELKRRFLASPPERAALLGALARAGGSDATDDGSGHDDPLELVSRILLSARGQTVPAPAPAEAPAAKRMKPGDGASGAPLTGFEGLDEAEDEELE